MSFHMAQFKPDVCVTEIDNSAQVSWHEPAIIYSSKGPSVKAEIIQHGKYWTRKGLHDPIPRKFYFKNARAAKRFFSQVQVARSSKQLTSLWG